MRARPVQTIGRRWRKTITVPQGAAALYITFGMYQASGAMYFDKVSLSETGGNKIVYLYDDFEKDNGSRWNKVSYSGNASFPVVEDAPETPDGAGTFAQGHLRGTAHRLADVAVFECQRAEFRGKPIGFPCG